LVEPPTAVQAEADLHDTASRKLPCAPAGLGVAWTRQRVPFHRSAKVTSVPEPFPEPPAAEHAGAAGQDRAPRKLNGAPERLGVAWTRQRVPFHRSAKVTSVPELFP